MKAKERLDAGTFVRIEIPESDFLHHLNGRYGVIAETPHDDNYILRTVAIGKDLWRLRTRTLKKIH